MVSNSREGQSQPEYALKGHFSARFGSLEARFYFPRLGGSFFGSDKDPSGTIFGSTFTYIHVILVGSAACCSLRHSGSQKFTKNNSLLRPAPKGSGELRSTVTTKQTKDPRTVERVR